MTHWRCLDPACADSGAGDAPAARHTKATGHPTDVSTPAPRRVPDVRAVLGRLRVLRDSLMAAGMSQDEAMEAMRVALDSDSGALAGAPTASQGRGGVPGPSEGDAAGRRA